VSTQPQPLLLLEGALAALRSPEATGLETSERSLTELLMELRNGSFNDRETLTACKSRLSALRALAAEANGFYGGWLDVVRSRSAGYTAQGGPGNLEFKGEICLEG